MENYNRGFEEGVCSILAKRQDSPETMIFNAARQNTGIRDENNGVNPSRSFVVTEAVCRILVI